MQHPGPRPPDLAFPFDEAKAALQAADALSSGLTELIATHRKGVSELLPTFEGQPRRDLETALEEALAVLRDHASSLSDQAHEIRRWIEDASRQIDIRTAEQRRYDDRLACWHRAQHTHEGIR